MPSTRQFWGVLAIAVVQALIGGVVLVAHSPEPLHESGALRHAEGGSAPDAPPPAPPQHRIVQGPFSMDPEILHHRE